MLDKSKTSLFVKIIIFFSFLAGYLGVAPGNASAEVVRADCVPGSGWMWTPGPSLPDVAVQVEKKLSARGIAAEVQAQGYGETDSCGTYHSWGVDFTIRLSKSIDTQASQQTLEAAILPVLQEHGQPHLGKVKLLSAQGRELPLASTNTETALESTAIAEGMDAGEPITKNVYVIVYDPILSNGQRLSQRLGWSSHASITQQTVALFQQATGNRLNYAIAYTTVVPAWPVLADGFQYDETQYLAVIANPSLHHEPTGVDYNKIVNDPQFDLCGKASRGEIDEVWIYNGPWFGFYESTLAGPGAFWYNSPSVPGPHNCNRLLPIMGPSPERSVNEAVHNFTHRSESTMSQVYGGWQQNNTSTSWNKFGLVKAQSPNYSYSGCGSSHYPPNATTGYSYTDPASVLSNCDDFLNYPNLSDPLTVAKSTSCTAWNCVELNYYSYWFGHFPSFPGCGPDHVANDWWKYLLSPGYALSPSLGCQLTHMISGNVGTGNVTLSYTDGTAKTVTSDPSGNYFLIVSDNWSGTLTPSKLGFTSTPASRSFSSVLGEQYNQDFTANGTAPTRYYVNGATGNNSNSCITPAAPCRNIQEAVNKASPGNTVYVTTGTYHFSTNSAPNVVIIDKDLTLSGGWNPDFSAQTGASTIDGSSRDNGILAISGTVVVENFIVQNSVSQNSGAVYIVNGNFTLRRSTLRSNHAYSNGAGIFLDNGALTVVNSTISDNVAGGSGGGIYASYNTGSSVNIQNSTIAYNQASSGGGISRTNGAFNVVNSIVANNTATTSPDCQGTLTSSSYSIIENMSGCSISSGSNNLYVDPQIDPSLTGVMQVHTPQTGSPAINAGTMSACPGTDQLGNVRPQGITCDIGSVEVIGDTIAPTVTSITRTSSSPTLNGVVGYRVTLSETVVGVDAGDFRLTTSGLSGSSILAVSGSGSVYTLNVNTGTGSGTLRLDVVDDDSIKDLFLNPLGGPGLGNGSFTSGEVYSVSPTQTLSLISVAGYDGWVLESGETTNVGGSLNFTTSTFDVGDDKANKQYVGFLHFDTAGLPDNAVITSVTLKVRKQGVTGTDPFTTHGALLVDIQKPYFGSTVGLVVGDFQATAGLAPAASFGSTPVDSWYSASLSSGYSYVNLTGTTQIRLRFTRDDDNDRKADSVKFYSGDGTAAYRPQLIVQYYIP